MKSQENPRIVSKTRYLGYLSRLAMLHGSGTILLLLGSMGAVICVGILIVSIVGWALCGFAHPGILMLGLGFSLFAGFPSMLAIRLGIGQCEKANRMEPVIPLTRQSAEQLPAEESLVRASSEPADVQPEVLLRAAGSDMQTPPQELLRANRSESDDAP